MKIKKIEMFQRLGSGPDFSDMDSAVQAVEHVV